MAIRSFRDLRVWQAAMDLPVGVYRLTAVFSRLEAYGFTSPTHRPRLPPPPPPS